MPNWSTFVVAAIVIALLACYIGYNEKRSLQLELNIRNLKEEVKREKIDTENIKQETSSLKSKQAEDVGSIKNMVDGLNSDSENVKQQISSLTAKQTQDVDNIQNVVAGLNSESEKLKQHISSLTLKQNEDIASLQEMVEKLNSDTENIKQETSSLKSKQAEDVDSIKNMVDGLNSESEKLKQRISSLTLKQNEDIASLQQMMKKLNSESEKSEQHLSSLTLKQTEDIAGLQQIVRKLNSEMPLSCKKDWILFNGNCYYIGKDRKSWSAAQDFCKSMSSNLVKIKNVAEHLWIKSIMTDRKMLNIWIGANDFINKGVWTWVSDSSRLTFTKWVPGEPNNYQNVEHCAQITGDTNYDWNDTICGTNLNYICEIEKKV